MNYNTKLDRENSLARRAKQPKVFSRSYRNHIVLIADVRNRDYIKEIKMRSFIFLLHLFSFFFSLHISLSPLPAPLTMEVYCPALTCPSSLSLFPLFLFILRSSPFCCHFIGWLSSLCKKGKASLKEVKG